MSDRKVDYPCLRCKAHVKRNDKAVKCSLCQLWVHVTCEQMPDECFKILDKANKYGGMHWSCQSCSAFAEKFNAGLQEMNRRLVTIEKKVDIQTTDIDSVKSDVSDIKEQVNKIKEDSVKDKGNSAEGIYSELRERENRKLNVLVHNIKESDKSDKDERVKEDFNILSEVSSQIDTEVRESDIKFMTRIGKKSDSGPRPLLVGLKDMALKDKLLSNAPKLAKCDEPLSEVNFISDLTKIQRKEENLLREEVKQKNEGRTADEAKNFIWKLVGRRGERRITKASQPPLRPDPDPSRDRQDQQVRRGRSQGAGDRKK